MATHREAARAGGGGRIRRGSGGQHAREAIAARAPGSADGGRHQILVHVETRQPRAGVHKSSGGGGFHAALQEVDLPDVARAQPVANICRVTPRPRRACETIMPTSYRSVQRMEDVQDEAYDGQTVYLPPDRPTLLSHQRMRDRVTGTWRPPFVARTARTHFTSSWGDCSRVPGF